MPLFYREFSYIEFHGKQFDFTNHAYFTKKKLTHKI